MTGNSQKWKISSVFWKVSMDEGAVTKEATWSFGKLDCVQGDYNQRQKLFLHKNSGKILGQTRMQE